MMQAVDETPAGRLPDGAIVLHIGPHKTGTTTVQAAFHAARDAVRMQGVHYPGPNSQPMFAIYAITGQHPPEIRDVPLNRWTDLVADIGRAGARRTLVSSEGLCDADEPAIARIVRDLGVDRTHVVVTLRPLVELLPSQWQQSAQEGLAWAYEQWLDAVLNRPDTIAARSFWHRHRHDALVGRWQRALGPGRVHIVISGAAQRDRLLPTFEELMALAPGTLPMTARANRSLTADEIELARAIHARFRHESVPPRVAVRIVRDGVAERLRRRAAAPDEPRLVTPAWARLRASDVGEEMVRGLERLDLTVHGGTLADLATADRGPDGGHGAADTAEGPPPEVASAGPAGVLLLAGKVRGRPTSVHDTLAAVGSEAWVPVVEQLRAESLSTLSRRQILRGLQARARRSGKRFVRRAGAAVGQRPPVQSAPTQQLDTGDPVESRPAWADAAAAATVAMLQSVAGSPDAARPADFETADLAVLRSRDLVALLARRLVRAPESSRTAPRTTPGPR
jgi:hypothetical protein